MRLTERNDNLSLEKVLDSVGVPVLVVSTDYSIKYCNQASRGLGMCGGLEPPIGRHCFEVVCANDSPPKNCAIKEAVETKAAAIAREIALFGKEYDLVATPMLEPGGIVNHVILVYNEITDRKAAIKALEDSEGRYRALIDSTSDFVMIVDGQGRPLFANKSWNAALGLDTEDSGEVLPRDYVDPGFMDDYLGVLKRALRTKKPVRFETVFSARSGQRILLDGEAAATEKAGLTPLIRIFLRDVTKQKLLENEIAKSQKLESVGVLAGGIAHDFNNIFTSILGNISLAKLYAERGLDFTDKLKKAEDSVLRAKKLTKQLLTFSKGGAPVKEIIAVEGLVRDAVAFTLSGQMVRPNYRIDNDLWPIEADPGQIEQVVNNIVLNSVEAMPEGGNITVRMKNLPRREVSYYPVPENDYVLIEFSDEGEGITQEDLGHVFDPYFTTKADGSGLGLTVAYSVVKNHGGIILADSKPGEGARFTILLPASLASSIDAVGPDERMVAGAGRVLLMDDEAEIREMVASIMGSYGYEVVTTADGEEALEVFAKARKAKRPFDLVIMDLTIPGGMGGEQAIHRLRELDVKTPVVVSSGYYNSPTMSDFKDHGFTAVLPKPYRVETLLELAKRLIGEN